MDIWQAVGAASLSHWLKRLSAADEPFEMVLK
jgi:hypothetical protein